ncbi:hypothetical protein [Staphylococcus phage vB_SauM-V1SA20]|nr:hypothetical protein [Staphylococcus phage vB_SauM-V1SA20]
MVVYVLLLYTIYLTEIESSINLTLFFMLCYSLNIRR